MSKKERENFIAGGSLFVIGLIALYQGHFDATLFLMGLGVVFMAAALGVETCKKVFDFFSIFKNLWKEVSKSS